MQMQIKTLNVKLKFWLSNDKVIYKVFFILSSFYLLFICFFNPVHDDEPFYSYSAQKLFQGGVPYLDFIFHQMPFTLYFYSFTSIFGVWSLLAGRILSALLFLTAVYFLFKIVLKINATKNYRIYFLVLIILNSYLVRWITLIKTYSPVLFLLALSIFMLYLSVVYDHKKLVYIFLSGFFHSCLIFTRIVFVTNFILFLIFVIYLYLRVLKTYKIKFVVAAVVGISLPFAYFIIIYWNYFNGVYLNTVFYNILLKQHAIPVNIQDYWRLFRFFLIPQIALLTAIIIFSGFKYSLFEKYLIISVLLFFGIHLGTQMLTEYMVPIIPLIILLASLRMEKSVQNIKNTFIKTSKINLCRYLMALYILFFPVGSNIIPAIKEKDINLNPVQIAELSRRIDKIKGDTILSSWEGYVIYTHKKVLLPNSYMSVFYNDIVNEMGYSDRKNVSIKEDYKNLILNKIPDIIVINNSNPFILDEMLTLIQKNYQIYTTYKGIDIYLKI
jgi:hypothetical protein